MTRCSLIEQVDYSLSFDYFDILYLQDVPDNIVDALAREFDRVPGRDWERFAEGLGNTLQ